ncbi:hypothetical protein, partial [Streptomyces sp. SID4985]|uniref:hypothetical protein n=1 Tax=Streptomyces sp. SID4985 TaxID=2690292 RepID=UPI001F1DEFB1
EWARRAEDTRLQAALQLRMADTLDRLGDPAAARLHRAAAERILGGGGPGEGPGAGPCGGDRSGTPRQCLRNP